MKKLIFGGAAAALLTAGAAVTPASAQVYVGADPGGVGVRVGPFGVGVGPDYWGWRDYAYVPDCRLIRERVVTPHHHVFWRTRRVCD